MVASSAPGYAEQAIAAAAEAVGRLGDWRADDRGDWLNVGMGLHDLQSKLLEAGAVDADDSRLLDLWIDFSQRSTKFREGECETQWAGFHAGGGITIGTIRKMAREDEAGPQTPPEARESEPLCLVDVKTLRLLNAKLRVPGKVKPPPVQPAATKPSKPPRCPPLATLDALIAAAGRKIGGQEAGRWCYEQPDGTPALWTVRFNLADGDKTFRQFRREADGRWKLGGLERCPLYAVRDILARPNEDIFVCEGEKATDALRASGILATTSCQGAQSPAKTDWLPLAGRSVLLLPDNDDAGERYRDKVETILSGLNPQPTLRILRLPNLPPKGDAFDYVESRRAAGESDTAIRAEVLALAAAAEKVDLGLFSGGTPNLIRPSDVVPEILQWDWRGRIARKKLSLFVGNGGGGKTFVFCAIIAHITRGWPLPGDERPSKPGFVIFVAVEDDIADTLVHRLTAAGADLDRVLILKTVRVRDRKTGKSEDRPFDLRSGITALHRALQQHPETVAVFIDPITGVLGDTDANDVVEVRRTLQPLVALAEQFNIAVVASSHLNKSGGQSALHRTLGSGAFVQLARMVFFVVPDRSDDSRRYLLSVKNNLAVKPPGLAFSMQPSEVPDVPRVVWEQGTVDMDADQALAASESGEAVPRKFEEIKEGLATLLEDGQWLPKAKIIERIRMNLAGHAAVKTIERAAKSLGVESDRRGFPAQAMWRLPPQTADSSEPQEA